MAARTFREGALSMPEAYEQDHFGAPSFRICGKIFAQLSADGATGLVKLPLALQEWLATVHPEGCRIEPRWGRHGWTRITCASLGADLCEELIDLSWRAVAPRRLRNGSGARPDGPHLPG